MESSNWLSPLLGSGLLVSLLLAVMPEGGPKRIGGMVACALLFFTILPGIVPAALNAGGAAASYRESLEEKMRMAEQDAEKEALTLIRQYAGALIEKKAEELSLEIKADCDPAIDENGDIYLYGVTITYRQRPDEEDSVTALKEWMRKTLGIPLKRQKHIR
ncbi:MAG: hypothetical protein IJM21_03505 [Clostridia bacterium]|nr:hypothetical protein [Clostridia bacterium]